MTTDHFCIAICILIRSAALLGFMELSSDRLREAAALAVPDGSGRPPVVSGNDLQRLMSAGVRDMGARMFEKAVLMLGDRRPRPSPSWRSAPPRAARPSPFSDLEFGILLPDGYARRTATTPNASRRWCASR